MSQKEIDIVDFYIRIASFVKRRFLLIVVISLLGVGLGGLRFYTSPPKYKVIMIASSQVIDKQYVYQLASPIKMYIEQREYENLSNYIGCDVETLSAITKFELDSTLLHSVKFSMNFSDSEKISDFRNSIIQFYKNQKFINSYYEREKTALNDFVKVIDDEIAKINAFQDKILNDDQLKSGINVYTAMSGSHEELVQLYEKRYDLREKLAQAQPISFITDDLIIQEKKSLLKSLIIWGGIFFVVSLIIGVYLDLVREARGRKLKVDPDLSGER